MADVPLHRCGAMTRPRRQRVGASAGRALQASRRRSVGRDPEDTRTVFPAATRMRRVPIQRLGEAAVKWEGHVRAPDPRIVSAWSPEPPSATDQVLRMVPPEFQGDLALLARRLVPSVLATPAGALFQPPVRLEDGLEYVLGLLRRDEVTHADLAAELERVFAGVGPALRPLHELPALLEPLP